MYLPLSLLAVPTADISPDAQVPSNPRDGQSEPQQHRRPKGGRPPRKPPPVVAEGIEGAPDVGKVADEEGEEEGGKELLLAGGVGAEVVADGLEDEKVERAEERADV